MKDQTMKKHLELVKKLKMDLKFPLRNKVSDLIEDYNAKYEDQYIDTYDMSSLFTQLKDYVEDHS